MKQKQTPFASDHEAMCVNGSTVDLYDGMQVVRINKDQRCQHGVPIPFLQS